MSFIGLLLYHILEGAGKGADEKNRRPISPISPLFVVAAALRICYNVDIKKLCSSKFGKLAFVALFGAMVTVAAFKAIPKPGTNLLQGVLSNEECKIENEKLTYVA